MRTVHDLAPRQRQQMLPIARLVGVVLEFGTFAHLARPAQPAERVVANDAGDHVPIGQLRKRDVDPAVVHQRGAFEECARPGVAAGLDAPQLALLLDAGLRQVKAHEVAGLLEFLVALARR
jgi:hypothetical protein